MKLGITATRDGLTLAQKCAVRDVLLELGPVTELHHGDCIGGDEEVRNLAFLVASSARLIVHPPRDSRYRAWTEGAEVRDPLPYLQRNHNIVDGTSMLLALPNGEVMRRRGSGTWATVRYALGRGKPVWLVPPSGEVIRGYR